MCVGNVMFVIGGYSTAYFLADLLDELAELNCLFAELLFTDAVAGDSEMRRPHFTSHYAPILPSPIISCNNVPAVSLGLTEWIQPAIWVRKLLKVCHRK